MSDGYHFRALHCTTPMAPILLGWAMGIFTRVTPLLWHSGIPPHNVLGLTFLSCHVLLTCISQICPNFSYFSTFYCVCLFVCVCVCMHTLVQAVEKRYITLSSHISTLMSGKCRINSHSLLLVMSRVRVRVQLVGIDPESTHHDLWIRLPWGKRTSHKPETT